MKKQHKYIIGIAAIAIAAYFILGGYQGSIWNPADDRFDGKLRCGYNNEVGNYDGWQEIGRWSHTFWMWNLEHNDLVNTGSVEYAETCDSDVCVYTITTAASSFVDPSTDYPMFKTVFYNFGESVEMTGIYTGGIMTGALKKMECTWLEPGYETTMEGELVQISVTEEPPSPELPNPFDWILAKITAFIEWISGLFGFQGMGGTQYQAGTHPTHP